MASAGELHWVGGEAGGVEGVQVEGAGAGSHRDGLAAVVDGDSVARNCCFGVGRARAGVGGHEGARGGRRAKADAGVAAVAGRHLPPVQQALEGEAARSGHWRRSRRRSW